ncbi:hypothetical protein A2V68_00595 [candidate division Kazan bacterium RBG_13_50_9]|uniref:DDH domain-containing protein n=1 Tax=candidate division Kazan bacterium RBG_13_50_9 TaxID=1798535 RepID=A0A1F4NS34_UNCK3|nr:MAG: hypothetical protein A2V68_00595 [candidate division Kazan bacterium RBG_13_50_9]
MVTMELTPKQQALELINKARQILIVPGRPDGDAIGSAVALQLVLKKLGKDVSTVVLDPLSSKFKFMPEVERLEREFKSHRDFVISLDCASATADKLVYNFDSDRLNIIVTPKAGSFRPQDVSFSDGKFPFDIVITLDAADFDQLGKMYEDNPKLFQSVPVINVDHHASNDYFGAVNLVDLTATSTAEILVGLIEALGPSLIDEEVATALLTGIINDTGSFQHSNTTPKSLTVAAQMVGFGARQQEIIKYLFKTKELSTLKLWGRVLSNIRFDAVSQLAWGSAALADFAETGAEGEQLSGLIDELMTSVPEADVVVLLSEREPGIISGSIRTKKGIDASDIAKIFGGGGHHGAAGFRLLDTSIAEAEDTVISRVKEYQAKRHGGLPPMEEGPKTSSLEPAVPPPSAEATGGPGAGNPPLDKTD